MGRDIDGYREHLPYISTNYAFRYVIPLNRPKTTSITLLGSVVRFDKIILTSHDPLSPNYDN